jgi:ELWxxDGT repeat protein
MRRSEKRIRLFRFGEPENTSAAWARRAARRRQDALGEFHPRFERLEDRFLLSIGQSEPRLSDSAGSVDAQPITGVALASAADVISVRYDLPALVMQATGESVGGQATSEAVMPGTEQSSVAGQPILPLVPVEIVVPYGCSVGSIDVVPGAMVALSGSYVIEPSEDPWQISSLGVSSDADAAGGVSCASVTSGTFPESVLDVVGVQRERGVEILRVNLNPVRYAADVGAVSYYTTLTLNVSLADAGLQSLDASQTVRYRPDDLRTLETEVVNPEALESYRGAAAAGGYAATAAICDPADSFAYVAITSQAFASASTDYTINDLIASKQARGMSATVVTLESIYANYSGVDHQEQIRNFITDAYNNWETDYVLLGGDSNVVPYRGLWVMNDAIPSDLYYQCLDGNFNSDGDSYWGESTDGPGGTDVDLSAEVYIGRASAETTAEMANWVYKTIAYEDSAAADYRRSAMMVGEHLGFGGVSEYATASMEEIRLGSSSAGYTTVGFAADPTFTTSTLYDSSTYTWSASDLMNLFNGGQYGAYNHLGHANTSYVMKLVNSNVDTLTNSSNFFFIYSQGCYPGDFPNDAIAEHFTTSTRTGAAAVVFNSRYGYGRGNSTDGPSQRPNREFWDALFNEHINRLGAMNADSHEDVLWGISDSYIRWVTYETTLFGDPAAEVVSLDLSVVGSTPAGGEVVTARPTDFVINFSDPYLQSSVAAGDLLVNGIAADSVTLETYSVTFHYNTSPVTAQGTQTMSVAAGTILRASDNGGNRAWNASFRYDAAPMQVISSEPADGSTVLLPFTTLRVNVSEEIDSASVGTDDVMLSQGTVTAAVRKDSDTVEYTLSGITQEATLTVSMPAGALSDLYGNPSLAYSGSLVLDFGTFSYPTPLDAKPPLGSLVYDPSISGQITSAADTDSFTVSLDAGQTLTAVVVPGATLTPTVTVTGPDGTTGPETAPGIGKQAFLQTVTVATAGTYTVTVGSSAGTTGGYTLQLILNAAVEAESHDGAANDDFASAQPLDSAFIAIEPAGKRAAVLGVTDPTSQTFLSWNMDSDPGWTYQGEWAWGQPAGYNGDPTSAHTGSSVVGYNLGGQYANSMPVYYATTPAFSTLGRTDVQLSFWRWLGVERNNADHASIEVSCDGSTWTTVWANGTSTLSDAAWNLQTYDISAVADNQAQVFLRFGMGPTNSSVTYCGWNIDDVSLSASTSSNDYYSFTLAAGQSATVGLTSLAADSTMLTLYGPSLQCLALSRNSDGNFADVISNFVAPAAGIYYVHVTGTGAASNLVVTKDMQFDTEPNDELAESQIILAAGTVLGHVGPGNGVATEPLALAAGDPAYYIWDWNTRKITRIDTDGTITPLGSAGSVGSVTGLAYDTHDAIMYGSEGSGVLYSFDLSTGAATNLGSCGMSIGSGLAYSPLDDRLYSVNSAGQLVRIDPGTMTAQVVSSGGTGSGAGGLAFNPLDNRIYTVLGTAVYSFDAVTFAGPTAHAAAGVASNFGMAHNGESLVLGPGDSSGGANRTIWAYDPVSGSTTAIFPPGTLTSYGFDGLEFVGAGDQQDFYKINVQANDTLQISTTLPGVASGEFNNALDVAVELLDPSGVPVAFSSAGQLSHVAVASGWYTIRVLAENGTRGEYVLQVAGATGSAPAFAVESPTEPAEGSRLRSAAQWTVHFGDAVLLSTLDAADLTVDGVSATAVTVVDDRTATFTLPVGLADGLHTLAIAAGAVQDLQLTPVSAWTAQFTLDTTPPRVISSTIQEGDAPASGNLTLTIQFNEPMRSANLDLGDLQLLEIGLNLSYAPASWGYDPTGTILTVTYAGLPDDSYAFMLRSGDGRFEDVVGIDLDGEPTAWPIPGNVTGDGVEGGNFHVSFVVHAWGANHAPTAVDDVYGMSGNGVLVLAVPGVLANDGDPDSNPLNAVLVDPPAHGSVVLAADGSFQYTPLPGFFGADQFTYRASDGAADSVLPATVRVRVGPPRLLSDFQTNVASSNPTSLVEIDGTVFFTATDALHGTELWKTDGTQNGTVLVKDIYPGVLSSNPNYLVSVNGTLFFSAFDPTNGTELWRSDGTAAGTVLVKHIYSGASSSSPAYLTNVGGVLYFAATDSNGSELWKSDGTDAGTLLVKDIYGGGSSSPNALVNVGGTLYFAASDAATGRELWKSDGTSLGTTMVKDIISGTATSSLSNLTAVGARLFFVANDGTSGAELWTSDGTAEGTVMLRDIYPGTGNANPNNLTAVGNNLFFQANDPTNGTELWTSDGTAAGTALVRDIYSGAGSSSPAYLVNVGGTLFFSATDSSVRGVELWKSDGTTGGTVLVRDVFSGGSSSSPQVLANIGGILFFSAWDANGRELWRSDGTDAGTVMVADAVSGNNGSTPLNLTNLGGIVIFTANTPTTGRELWRSDGTAARTMLAKDIRVGTADSSPAYFTDVNGTAYFTVTTAAYGTELWKSDGSSTGTSLVKDIISGGGGSGPGSLVNVGGTLFFAASDGSNGYELWKSDGTAGGTAMVKNIWTGSPSSSPGSLTNVNGTLFFTANDGTNGLELWKSDGTDAGTVLVKDIWSGSTSSSIAYMTSVGGTLFFRANDGSSGYELWKSDGTPDGTVMVKDIYPGSSGSGPCFLVNVNGTLFFQATDAANGYELWRSDGTDAGTAMVKDIFAGSGYSSYPGNLVNVNGTLFFSAYDSTNGTELWKSNGTNAGTVLVKDLYSGANGSSPSYLTSVDGRLFFAATDANGMELWRSDGTASGTVMVKDICPGSSGSTIRSITNVAGVAYFVANDGVSGAELWKSDGTAAGTAQADLAFAADTSDPQSLAAVGRMLFLSAVDSLAGREVWVVPDPPRVMSIVATDPSPTTQTAVHYTVTFTRAVTAVDIGDFSLYAEGLPGATITDVSGSGSAYTITVAAGTGTGRLRLSVLDDDSIVDVDANPLGGPGRDNGVYAADQWYVVDRMGPVARILDLLPDSRITSIGQIDLLFTESVTGFDLDDLRLTRDGSGNLLTVAQTLTGAGSTWFLGNLDGLTATPGRYALRIVAAGSGIVDAMGNAMADDAIRVWTTGDHTPPSAFDESYATARETPLTVAAHGVLINDTCSGGCTLSASLVAGPRHGTLNYLNADGSFQYTPDVGFAGTDSFTYRASDGAMDATGTVWLRVGPPQLVADINTAAVDSGANAFTEVGSLAFYIATDAIHGTELWRTDGTVAGTFLLKDIYPGTTGSSPAYFTNVNGVLYFRANDGVYGSELWRSDGTPDGTVMVEDIYPGSVSSSPNFLVNLNGTLFFQANDGVYGAELWRSDGTADGTRLVKDIYPGGSGYSSNPANLVNVAGTLYFQAYTSVSGNELWRSDGTAAGTILVKDVYSGMSSSNPASLVAVGGSLFFIANDGTTGTELWKSDGTTAGTSLVKDIVVGTGSPSLAYLTALGNILSFRATTSDCGTELWSSDGTEAGTIVLDIYSGTGSSNPNYLTNVNGTLFFQATNVITGTELWRTDGTLAGTALVRDICSDGNSSPVNFVNFNGVLCFQATDSINGYELWKSDGTYDGTILVKDGYPGGANSSPGNLGVAGGILYFAATDGVHGRELWRSDGTAAGTGMLRDVHGGNNDSTPLYLVNAGGTLYFRASSSTTGTELWKADGTAAPTVVKDIYAGGASSNPAYLTYVPATGTLFFEAGNYTNGLELWKTDGTEAGTVLVKDIRPGTNVSSEPLFLTSTGSLVFFRANDGTSGVEIWRSDGTDAGTFMLKDIYPGANSSNPQSLTNVNGTLFFQAYNSTNGYELWKSDGTIEGTVLLDIWAGGNSSSPANLFNAGGVLYFSATGSSGGCELWRSDGTAAGTTMVKDINPAGNSYPANIASVNGLVYFAANDGTSGVELWRSDGSAAGTVLVADLYPGTKGAAPANLIDVNGTLFFTADDGVNGVALWKSDGTAAGTVLVKDIAAGSGNPFIQGLTNVGGVLYFQANDGIHGGELWRSDGTSAGTRMVADIGADADGSCPQNLTECARYLYFTAVDGFTGRELWSLPVTNRVPVAAGDLYTIGKNLVLAVSTPGVLANDSDPDADPFQACLVSGPAHGTLQLHSDGSFAYTPASNYIGPDSFTYMAFDGLDYSAETLVSITVTAVNEPPVVGGLVGSPDPVVAGQNLLLTAIEVADPNAPTGTVTSVAFYRESNGTPGLQAGADTLVGTDNDPADGWSASVSTAGLAGGIYVYYAQATDNEGALSSPVSTVITVKPAETQIVSDVETDIAAAPGAMITFPVSYTTSSGDSTLTGLGLRMHYNSSLLTYNGLMGVLPSPARQDTPVDDLNNWDGDAATDKYVFVSWADTAGNWPNLPLAVELFTANFTVANDAAEGETCVRFSASSTAVGYGFESRPVTLTVTQANLDVDGNSNIDALSDGILILRYLFDPNGAWSVTDALGGGATRGNRPAIKSFLDSARATVLDVDGNGSPDALTDGILILRYLFDPAGAWSCSDAIGNGATRTTRAQIKAFLDQFNPDLVVTPGLAAAAVAEAAETPKSYLETTSAMDRCDPVAVQTVAGAFSTTALIAATPACAALSAPDQVEVAASSDSVMGGTTDGVPLVRRSVRTTSVDGDGQDVLFRSGNTCKESVAAAIARAQDSVLQDWKPPIRYDIPAKLAGIRASRPTEDGEAVDDIFGDSELDWRPGLPAV